MRVSLATSTCISSLLFAWQPAAAQQSSGVEQQAPPPAASEPGQQAAQTGLAEIIVTAQRRQETLQNAAIAVSAITGDSLASAGVTRPTELTSVVPSLQVGMAAGPYNLFYLRGVGNFNGNALSDSAIAFNFAGVYIGRPSSSTGFFYDLERVEVVKGPQGTLYGRNATGGAINVIPKAASLNEFSGEASVEYGNYDALRLDAALNLPLGDQAALRVAGIRVSHDGYMNNGMDDQDDWGGRVSFLVEPADNFRMSIVADYFDQGGRGRGGTPLFAPAGSAVPATFDVDDRIDFLSAEGQALYTTLHAGPLGRNFYPITGASPFLNNQYWGISSTIDWETSLGTLTVIPAYREAEVDYLDFGSAGFQIRQREKTDQTSVEARFATSDDKPLRALVGAFYFKEDTQDPFVSYVHQVNAQFQNRLDLSTRSTAIFGRLTYDVTPEFRLTVGARQTWEDKSSDGDVLSLTRVCTVGVCPVAPQIPYGITPPPADVPIPAFGPLPYGGLIDPVNSPGLIQIALPLNATNQADFKRFTWRAGADWNVTPENLLYASYETGFKAGGFFFTNDDPATPEVEGVYRPEKIEAFTIGSKNRFFNNRLQLNLEAFYWRYKDQQISHLTLDFQGQSVFATENVGRATFKGIEIETRLAATDTTTLSADLQYLDAKYNEFVYTAPNLNGGIANGTGCPNDSISATIYTVNCTGKRPPNAPEWTINLGAQQRIPTPWDGEFVLDARTHYQSRTLTGLEFQPIEEQDSYWLADAALTYYAPGRRYFIGGFINNIFNETVKASSFAVPFAVPSIYAVTLRPPRIYGVRAGVNF